jgi:signal transduction histidine kinase/ligand-binding sensor domain-containing protein
MRPGKAAATLLLACWAVPRPAAALDPGKALSQCTVDVWQVRDGLPGTTVRGITQTPDGYLWINVAGGVARYDGARITRLEAPRSIELQMFDVQDMFLGEDGALWLTPAYSDPLCLRRESLARCLPGSLGLAVADRLATVAARGDQIWAASRQRLVSYTRGARGFDAAYTRLPFGRVNLLRYDRRGQLWVGAVNGLFREKDGAFEPVSGPDGPVGGSVTSIFEGPGGRLWVSTTSALVRIEGEQITVVGHRDGLPAARPSQVIEDRDGNVWLGTEAGLVRYRDGRFVTFDQRDGLPDDKVTALFEDREGSLWVGTRAGGLAQFTDRTLVTRSGPPLGDHPAETVAEDEEGAIWVGTRWNGVIRWKDGHATSYTTADQLPNNHVTSIYPGRGEVWIGTVGGLARWRRGHLDQPAPVTTNIASLYLDHSGALWIGRDNGSLMRWQDGKLDAIPPPDKGRWGQIRGIQHDDQGRLLVLAVGGLAHLENDRLLRLSPERGLATVWGRAMHRDAQGTIWVGTIGSGLLRLQQGRFQSFGAAQGMVPDQLYQVLVDDEGFVWAGTSRGIIRVSKQSLTDVERGRRQRADLVTFERSDQRRDVAAARVHQPGAWKCRDGRLLFITDEGLVTIDPRRLRANPVPPSVLVQEAIVDGHRARRGERNRFPPGPGNLELHFAAITLLEPEKAVHRYLLEGFDDRWVDAGTRRVAYYTNIPPGRYRFRVQASNADGLWNETGDAIEFYLAPHFYRTGWFYGLCALGVLSLGLWFHRSRLARVRAEALATAAERARVARELHDSLLQEMSAVAMMINAIRTTLPAAAAGAAEKLTKIESTVTASLAETRRYVWDLRDPPEKPEAASDLEAGLGRLAAKAVGNGVECTVRREGEVVPLPGAVCEELLRMAQETLANAVKHARARYIRVRLCYDKTAVRLVVSDDGRGFDPGAVVAAQAGHFGLVGLRERATRLGATLNLDSRPGRGTTVEVTVPLSAAASAHG